MVATKHWKVNMSLTNSELARVKFEMGFNLLTLGADVYIGVTTFFENVIRPYLSSGPLTTSSTVVVESTPLPTPVTLVVSDPTGLTVNESIQVDVDALMEIVTIQSITGSNITVLLSKPHTGTYPVIAMDTGVVTSSVTIVPSLLAPPRSVDLTLLSAVGFSINDTVIVDDGTRQESTRVENVVGNVITVLLTKGHVGTYQVTTEGGESIVRGILQILQSLSPMGGNAGGSIGGIIGNAVDTANLKRVDEIEWYGANGAAGMGASMSGTPLQQTMWLIEYYRDQLASALGMFRMNKKCGSGAALY